MQQSTPQLEVDEVTRNVLCQLRDRALSEFSVAAIRELLTSPRQISQQQIPITATAMNVLPAELRSSYVVREGAAAATWLSHLLHSIWFGAPSIEAGRGESMMHHPVDQIIVDIVVAAFSDEPYSISVERDRHARTQTKQTRRDLFVDVEINRRPYTVIQEEDKTREAFVEGDDNNDPTRQLIQHTPWRSWKSLFGMAPFTLALVVIGDSRSINVQLGALVREGNTGRRGTFEALSDGVDIKDLAGRMRLFHMIMKLLPYMKRLAHLAAEQGSVSLRWSRAPQTRGPFEVSLNVAQKDGTLAVVKRWSCAVPSQDLTTFRQNLQQIYQRTQDVDPNSNHFQKLIIIDLHNPQRLAFHFTPFGKTATPSLVALRHVVEAVALLHSIYIVHRDLRWPNVVFNDANQRFILIDFDDAVMLTLELPQAPAVTDDQLGRGNHSPACFDGPHGREVDVWSIGHLCEELAPNISEINQQDVLRQAAAYLKTNATSATAQDFLSTLQSPPFPS